ncbi:Dimethyl-sulfide monooxygenase [Venturia nashicola]|uniref:Dimethyl-sulfide monooxygenase n=1 Tax=Venturia nashicola TaxID=86259 RepID=A0A4Z1P9P7_9PEZI|nr:Dimethyl-sulfide monooxygenase [Venturia nashicola]
MTRVNSTATAVRSRRSASSAIADRSTEKKPHYKVELKLITAQKKQLKISNNPPPPTYSFVAAGSEAFTTYCKDLCRKQGRTVHASQTATDARGRGLVVNDPNRVGYYIGRDGFFFPNNVIQKACNWFGVRIDAAGKTTEPNDFLSARVRYALGRHGQRDKRQQIDAAVREMFPRIPPEAADEIIKHAFESASKPGEKARVGNARNLDLAGRVQLAVTAHIRHRYTNYDQLLKNGVRWHDARATVNPPCVAVLRNWMGEDNAVELEETFQEWIDLCDDDEDEDESSSMDISDDEPDHRKSLNAVDTVHEAAGPSHSRVPARETRADSRVVRYHPDPEQVLPSIESPARPATLHGRQNPQPRPLYYGALPPAPSPPSYRAPLAANYERHLPPSSAPYSHRSDPIMFGRLSEQARALPRDCRAPVIDLTDSPTIPRTYDDAMPPMVHVGSLRGGDGRRHDDLNNSQAGNTGRYSSRSQQSPNSGDGMIPYVATRPPPPSRVSRREPPHPAVPRSGWVNYATFNRQGEAVR